MITLEIKIWKDSAPYGNGKYHATIGEKDDTLPSEIENRDKEIFASELASELELRILEGMD